MKWFKLLISVLLSIGIFYLLNTPQGVIPPLGKFLNPFAGFWQNGSQTDELLINLTLPGLQDDVKIVWDERRVPHIFAENMHDLMFAQGFIIARDRLWQMEFQTHAAAGRLSEILGKRTIEYDRFRRRIGMNYGAEKGHDASMQNPELKMILAAYSDGVNAWIDNLPKKNLPVEYKILDYEPESWSPFKSSLLLKQFSWTLTFRSRDRIMTHTRKVLGDRVMDQLFPDFPPVSEPVIPKNTKWNFQPKSVTKPDGSFEPTISALFGDDFYEYGPINGSNNWVVSGAKTKSGFPILSNDPHLALTLPSIWYEMQLTAPGLNVYGITSPGAPGIIVGFNENIAWGVTNAGSDVLDWYEIKFKDESKQEYLYDGSWRKTTRRIEEIKVKGSAAIMDTVLYTHHGPIVYREDEKPFDSQVPPGTAMRWIALDASIESLALLKLSRAENYQDFKEALKYYDSPAQNFVFADRNGDIAMHHNGKFPLRWKNQGKYIGDGSDPLYDWQEFIPKDQLPLVKNPTRGFISSANQIPVDESYPYYLGWNYAGYTRSGRINERLAQMEDITVQDMVGLQNDFLNIHARKVLPVLLDSIDPATLSGIEKNSYDELKDWTYIHNPDLIAPRIFNYWWFYLNQAIWKDFREHQSGSLRLPNRTITTDMILKDPDNEYFDDPETEVVEVLADLVKSSFKTAIFEIENDFGAIGANWQLGKSRGTNINHVASIPGMGREGLYTGGNFNTVNAIQRTHGPSWRMVVELGPEVKAWGIYPGGNSGNPGSKYYDFMVDDWVDGKIFELHFMKTPEEANDKFSTTTFQASR